MTGGRVHATDATNAARTMLYNIRDGHWDTEICGLLGVPMAMLPEVRDSAADFGLICADLFGREIPIADVVGDQQAATVGQACFSPGMMKSTYGTGCFALLNTGDQMVTSHNRLLTTIAYQLNGKPTYALEGSIFIAGAVVQWLRDGLKIIREARETQHLAEAADPAQDVVLVPAFTGLGAPYWRPECRGAIFGLTRNSGPAELAKAALESVGFQTRDLLEAMRADLGGGSGRRAAGRWQQDLQPLGDAVPVRHSGRAGGPSAGHRDHRAGGGMAGRDAGGALSRAGGICQELGAGAPVHTRNGRRHPRRQIRALAVGSSGCMTRSLAAICSGDQR